MSDNNTTAVNNKVTNNAVIHIDDLTPAPYTAPVLYPEGYEPQVTEDGGYSIIGDNIQHRAGEDINLFCVSPVIPVSYINNKLYKSITDSFNVLNEVQQTVTDTEKYQEYISYAVINSKDDIFHYYNSVYSSYVSSRKDYSCINNSFLMKYEDITCKSSSGGNYISLDENTNIDEFISKIQTTGDISNTAYFKEKSNYTGAFFYPDLESVSQVLTDGTERSSVVIKPGESISIPLTFEYFILKSNDNSTDSTSTSDAITSISKKLVFVIKDSVMSSGRYFELEITANQSSNFTDSIYTSIDNYTLDDSLTEN